MDTDSDLPLSSYAGVNYLRKEIARLEKLVTEKNGPSAAASVVAGSSRASLDSVDFNDWHRLLAGCHNPITGRRVTDKKHEALDGVRRRSAKERRERHKPTRLNNRPDVRIPRRVHWRHGVQIWAARTFSGFANEIDMN